MPVSCSSSALSGADGLVTFKPAGVSACLKDHTDFPAGSDITVPGGAAFRVSDPVVFEVEGGAKLDTALTAGTTYFVSNVSAGKIQVAATKGGTSITLNGDGGVTSGTSGPIATLDTGALVAGTGYTPNTYTGVALTGGTGAGATADIVVGAGGTVTTVTLKANGTGYTAGDVLSAADADLGGGGGTGFTIPVATITAGMADTAGDANHIKISFAEYQAVCSVQEWSLSLTKETADTTTLPCKVSSGGSKIAPVRTQVGTFLSGEGSMTILFTQDQTSFGQRLLANSVLVDSRVMAKLYILAAAGAGATVDDSASSYFEGEVNLLGFEITVNTEDVLAAQVSFSLADQPKALFGVKF